MSEKKDANFSEKQLKSKLNDIWAEVQTNLPSINFDDEIDSNKDNQEDEIDPDFLDKYDQINGLLDSDEDFEGLNSNNNLTNKYESSSDSKLTSLSDVNLDYLDRYSNEISNSRSKSKKKNFNTFLQSGNMTNSRNSDSASSAEKITKSIFETTNSKLSMEILDSINMDDYLKSVDGKPAQADNFTYSDNFKTSSTLNDEKILQKLAEMSMQISDDKNLKNLDYKTGAISSKSSHFNSSRNEDREKSANKEPFQFSSNLKKSFSLIENEILHNNLAKSPNIDDEITNELNAYLKSHNIKDGNLVETRRIDLRPSQNPALIQPKSFVKNELFNKNYKNGVNSNGSTKMKFLNDCSSSSSSSDSSDEDTDNNKALWIERYRKQKQQQNNSKKA